MHMIFVNNNGAVSFLHPVAFDIAKSRAPQVAFGCYDAQDLEYNTEDFDWRMPSDFEKLRRIYLATIDVLAILKRQEFIGTEAAKQAVYLQKAEIAAQGLPDAGPLRNAIDIEAQARNVTAAELVATWQAKADAWRAIAVALDGAAEMSRVIINAASDKAALDMALDAYRGQLDQWTA